VSDAPGGAPARGDADDVAFNEGGVGVGHEVGLFRGEMLGHCQYASFEMLLFRSLGAEIGGNMGWRGEAYFSELLIPFLRCYTDLDGFGHAAGGDHDADLR
jgi:hypothetical protein